MYKSNQSFNIELNFWKIFAQIPYPPRAEKLSSSFYYAFKAVYVYMTSLLDNTLTCHKILGIFHINTSSQTLPLN